MTSILNASGNEIPVDVPLIVKAQALTNATTYASDLESRGNVELATTLRDRIAEIKHAQYVLYYSELSNRTPFVHCVLPGNARVAVELSSLDDVTIQPLTTSDT